ncbi:MAG: formate dehydrogenase subunit alpha [Chloroflexi bacterium]|nr:MAG: formate dehydrogenase subunit alpha [Chloroflexota bacterium]
MTNSIDEIKDSDCIFVTGSNTAETHPVISYEMVRAVKNGANLIIVDPRKVPLVKHATLFLQIKPGTDIYVFLAMMHIIIREGWADDAFIAARTDGYEAFSAVLGQYTPEYAALMSGVDAKKIVEAARLYALGERVEGESKYGEERGRSGIFYAMGITQRSNGTDNVMTLANLAMLCGQIGKPSTGVNPLRGQANVQGACDIGCLVNVFPGYQRVTDDDARRNLAEAWGVEELPGKVGLTVVEAMHSVGRENGIHAMYIMGENPMMSDPNTSHVEKALRTLDFLVVQDIFPCETAQLAHVILPAMSSLEKNGTFTNTERRVQLLNPVLPAPGLAKPDWWITAALAQKYDEYMGVDRPGYWDFASPAHIFAEMAQVTPIYRGMSFARLKGNGLQWPCPDEEHPGTPILHVGQFTRGRGQFSVVTAVDPAEQPDEEYPLILTTGRILFHYHTGSQTRRSGSLAWVAPRGYVEVNTVDAEAVGVDDGKAIVIESRRGKVRTQLKVSDRVAPGTVFLAFHWREAPANMLTQDFKLDPVAKIPEYKVCAVRLENPRKKT